MKRALSILIIILALSGVVMAASSTTLGAYQVDYLGYEESGDNYVHTYAVTGSESYEPFADLSHLTLGMCVTELVSPLDGDDYTSPLIDECNDGTYDDCETPTSRVGVGQDPTTGVYGIKFDEPHPDIGRGDTAIFQITTSAEPNIGEIDVAVKYATHTETGKVDGQVCDPTSITLSSTEVNGNDGTFHVTTFLVMGLAFVTIFVLLRRSGNKDS